MKPFSSEVIFCVVQKCRQFWSHTGLR